MSPDSTNGLDLTGTWLAWSRGKVTSYPADHTLPEIFAQWVQRAPEAVAVVDGSERWSYRRLDEEASSIARSLVEVGVEEGDGVGIRAVRSAGFVAGVLGILKAGGAYVPIDPEEPEGRQALRKRDCRFLWNEGKVEKLEGRKLSTLNGQLPTSKGLQPTYVLYTSGSTGEPKGVVVPHRAIARLVCETDYISIQPDDVVAFHSNLSFDASTLEIWGPLLNGASLVVTPTETVLSPTALATHLAENSITFLWLTTSLFNRLVQETPGMFASLRALVFGGEAADAASIRRVLENGRPGKLINGYGPTETTTFAVCHPMERLEGECVPIGRPIANTDAFILDADLQPAAEGELYIGGPGVALGYLNQPELTAQRFIETPMGRLYKTGDRVRWLPDGSIEYLGRLDRQIKIRGHRIEPGEIEIALRRQPGVRQCAVLARPAPSGEPMLVGYFTGEESVTEVQLREALQHMLPAHMVPSAFVWLASLPLTPNGKLDYRALPLPALDHPELRQGYVAPRTPLEQRIASVWQRVLALKATGIDDNFFDLGGSSLLLLRLHAELLPVLGPNLRVVTLFRHPTIRSQAQFAESGAPAQPASAAQERAAKQRAALARQRLLSKR